MTRKNLLKAALIFLIVGVLVLAIAYFFFHFVTDEGITLVWHPEAGKPFVTDLIGTLGTLFLWGSATTLVLALTCFKREE